MTITKITYQNAYVTGPYLQHKPGFEAELEEREDPIEALMKLKAIADAFDKKVNNFEERLVSNDFPPPAIQVEKDPTDKERILALIKDINNETVIRNPDGTGGIDSWYKMVDNLQDKHPELMEAYKKRKAEIVAVEVKDILDRTNALTQKQ
jgi:hypothetical protein